MRWRGKKKRKKWNPMRNPMRKPTKNAEPDRTRSRGSEQSLARLPPFLVWPRSVGRKKSKTAPPKPREGRRTRRAHGAVRRRAQSPTTGPFLRQRPLPREVTPAARGRPLLPLLHGFPAGSPTPAMRSAAAPATPRDSPPLAVTRPRRPATNRSARQGATREPTLRQTQVRRWRRRRRRTQTTESRWQRPSMWEGGMARQGDGGGFDSHPCPHPCPRMRGEWSPLLERMVVRGWTRTQSKRRRTQAAWRG